MDNSIIDRLTLLDYFIVVAYLVILLVIGLRTSFSKKK